MVIMLASKFILVNDFVEIKCRIAVIVISCYLPDNDLDDYYINSEMQMSTIN